MPIFTLKKKNNKKHQHNFYPEDIQFSHSYVKLNYLNSWKQTKHQFFVNLRNLLIPLLFWRKFQLQSLLNFPLAVLFFFFTKWFFVISRWNLFSLLKSMEYPLICIRNSFQLLNIQKPSIFSQSSSYKKLCYRYLRVLFCDSKVCGI